MNELVFLLEERSMREMLVGFLPRILPPVLPYYLVSHEGKTDLEKSIPRKLRGWRRPGARFIILRDKDSADCHRVKRKLKKLCVDAGQPDALIRVVCEELEAWFLGDFIAIERAFGLTHLAPLERRAKYREPDKIVGASPELKRLVPRYLKLSGARSIGEHLDPTRNRSRSFRAFIDGLNRVIASLELANQS